MHSWYEMFPYVYVVFGKFLFKVGLENFKAESVAFFMNTIVISLLLKAIVCQVNIVVFVFHVIVE